MHTRILQATRLGTTVSKVSNSTLCTRHVTYGRISGDAEDELTGVHGHCTPYTRDYVAYTRSAFRTRTNLFRKHTGSTSNKTRLARLPRLQDSTPGLCRFFSACTVSAF